MFCEKCGKSIPDQSVFCPQCGSQQTHGSAPASGAATPPPLPPLPQAPPPQSYRPPIQTYQTPYTAARQQFASAQQEPLTTGQYFVMLLLLSIPFVNFILLLVWAFGNSNQNRKNFSRAMLLFMIVGIVISVIIVAGTGGLAAIMSQMQ